MLILASVSDKLRLTTLSASATDVHVSWLDNVSGGVQPGRTNTAIITSATTDICPSPAAGVFRSIKTMHIRNKGTTNNAVTVIHTDGATAVEIHKCSLPAGFTLQYIDEVGFVLLPPSGISTASKLLLKTYVPSGTVSNIIVGPEVLTNTDFDSFEFEWRLRPKVVVGDQLGYLVSFDNGATYLTGNVYGFAYSYGGTSGGGGASGGVLPYGYMGALAGDSPNWWSHGRSRVDAPYKNNVDHLMIGVSGGYFSSLGVHMITFSSYPGTFTAITNYQFYFQGGAGLLDMDGFMKVYGIK